MLVNQSISSVRGLETVEFILKDHKSTFLNNPPQLAVGLFLNRDIDFLLLPDYIINKIKGSLTEGLQTKFKKVYKLEPPVIEVKIYHYLHKRNKHLFPLLEKHFKSFKLFVLSFYGIR
jgi:hypothetical protein